MGRPNAYLAVQCMYLTLIITALQIVLVSLQDTDIGPLEIACRFTHVGCIRWMSSGK